MIIKNGKVFCEDGTFVQKDVYIQNHKIVTSAEEVTDAEVVDASGMMVLPGLVDVHSHGAYGHDFSDADTEGLKTILKYQKEHGITSYCPTSMTLPLEELKPIFATAKEAAAEDGAAIVGINMEGPFLDVKRKGAHKAEYIHKPDVEFFRECNRCADQKIKLVTLAVNVEGAEEFIKELKDEVTISIGHTSADYDQAKRAMELGALHMTHLYNAMEPITHRAPGPIMAAAENPDCRAELICDGYHIHPSVVRATFQLFGSERVVLVSDSMMATGMPDGEYQLGGQKVIMKAGKATLENGTLAGSATNLYDCMRKAMSFGIPVADAIFAATRNPAQSIGIYDRVGSVTPGKEADLLLVDEDFHLKQVI